MKGKTLQVYGGEPKQVNRRNITDWEDEEEEGGGGIKKSE